MPHRVQVIRRDDTAVSVTGAPNGTWEPVTTIGDAGTCWMGVEPVTGREVWSGANYASEATLNFVSRYWSALKRTDRLRFEGKDYEILDLLDSEMRHATFEIPAKYVSEMGDGAQGSG
jgi:SPP1 family predicted phage head-tail adaptor